MSKIFFNKINIRCYHYKGIYVRGYAFLKDQLLDDEKIAKKLYLIKNLDEILAFIKQLNGTFSIVIDNLDFTIAMQDRFSTYHMTYSLFNEQFYVTDDSQIIVDLTKQNKVNKNGYFDLIYTGFIHENETFVENIFKIMPSEYIVFDKRTKKVMKNRYYQYTYTKEGIIEDDKLMNDFEKVVLNVGNRLVKYLDNKHAVVLLSGGVDSRFCALVLKKMNYKNTILVTYGRKLSEEYIPAIKTAEALGFKHYFIPYKRSDWRDTYYNERSLKYVKYSSNLMVNAHIREHFVIEELLKRNIIGKDSVIVPGHLGNVAGRSFYNHEMINCNLSQVAYRSRMFYYDYKKMNTKHMQYLAKRIKEIIVNVEKLNNTFDICQTYERYSLDSYTVIYLLNSLRAYDFYGIKWAVPLLDHELVAFFEQVSMENKNNKKFLYDYVNSQMGEIPYNHSSKRFFMKVFRNLLDKRYSCIEFYKTLTLKCEANEHLPLFKRVYRYYRNFSAYCVMIETNMMKKQLNK